METLRQQHISEFHAGQSTADTDKAAEENSSAIAELTKELEGLKDKLGTAGAVRNAQNQGDIDVEKAKIIIGGEDSTVAAGISALNASGGKLNEAQKQQYDALKSIFDTLIGNHDALKGALITSHNLMLTQAQEIALIQGQLKTLASKQ